MFKTFIKDTGGNIGLMFGLLAVPLITATGASIDYGRAYDQRMVVQDALDAAALVANRLIGSKTTEEIRAESQAFFDAAIAGRVSEDVSLTIAVDGGTITATTVLDVPTNFLSLVGINDIRFNVKSVTVQGAASYEVVLVLDNSTSMSGTKISTLRTAAADLINSLFAMSVSNPLPDPLRIGLVPFTASVNVGSGNSTASWMDRTGIATNGRFNFDATQPTAAGNPTPYTNTFALWSGMTSAAWGGCVEARPYPNMVNDAVPTTATPATLFVPMFAPDEPGTAGNPRSGFSNSYLNDTGGTCVNTQTTTTTVHQTRNEACAGLSGQARTNCRNQYPNGRDVTTTTTTDITFTDLQLQERVCKYAGVTLGSSYRGLGNGPNDQCTADAIRPLSDNQAQLITAVNAMDANGYTNIAEGVMWGWRALSPTLPFAEGRAYDAVGNRKIMIIMTDGANTYDTNSGMNRSFYSAFNFVTHGVLGTTSTNEATVVAQMNARTLEACVNAKAQGIIVYTIAFQIPSTQASAIQILASCASDSSKAFQSDNNAALLSAFHLIAADIATLRIAE